MTALLSSLPGTTFAEYEDLKAILDAGSRCMAINVAGEVEAAGRVFPVYVATLGSDDPRAPAIGFFAGIHGLERIGTQLLLDYMRVLLCRLEWDALLNEQLQAGYGFGDSIWFPYAKSTRHIQHLPEMYALKAMLEGAHPHHRYLFEPQSLQYLAHGDLWDYAYDRRAAYREHPWAGHDLPHDDARWLVDAIARWSVAEYEGGGASNLREPAAPESRRSPVFAPPRSRQA